MGNGSAVLIADGDLDCRRKVSNLLARIGHRTIEAANGVEALELAKEAHPALVLLEVNLAGVSGYEVCRELRDTFAGQIAIIFLSGSRTEPYDRVAGLLLGADDYLVKPLDSDELLAKSTALAPRCRDAQGPGAGDAARRRPDCA